MQLNDNGIYRKYNDNFIRQGDVFAKISIVLKVEKTDSEINIEERDLPYVVVMSQACDLEQDYNCRINNGNENEGKYKSDKCLPTILVCPAYPAEALKNGVHLEEYNMHMEKFNSDRYKQIKQNSLYGYHYLKEDLNYNMPDLIIDFKHYYTHSREVVYSNAFRKEYICSMSPLFMANLSQRFCYYLSRIGLPDIETKD